MDQNDGNQKASQNFSSSFLLLMPDCDFDFSLTSLELLMCLCYVAFRAYVTPYMRAALLFVTVIFAACFNSVPNKQYNGK